MRGVFGSTRIVRNSKRGTIQTKWTFQLPAGQRYLSPLRLFVKAFGATHDARIDRENFTGAPPDTCASAIKPGCTATEAGTGGVNSLPS